MAQAMPDLTASERSEVSREFIALADRFGGDRQYMKVLREAERFERCGVYHRVYQCEKCLHQFKFPCSCNSRVCEQCGKRLYLSARKQMQEAVRPYHQNGKNTFGPKFLTLTITSERWAGGYPTQSQFKTAQRQVAELVKRFYSKRKAKLSRNGTWYLTNRWLGAGAISVPEFGRGGNLHFHLFIYGPFVSQKKLSETWARITGDSFIVDIRQVKNPGKTVAYLLKYITKPPQSDSYRDIAAWAWLLKGSRRLTAYGVLFGQVKTKVARDKGLGLVCLWGCGDLSYRGEAIDSGNVLLDWREMSKYVGDSGPPAWLNPLGYWHTQDKQFNFVN